MKESNQIVKYKRNFYDRDVMFRIQTDVWNELHTHNYWEIIFVADHSIINCLNDDKFVMLKHTLCLVKPDDRHKILRNGSEKVLFFNFEINRNFIKSFCDLVDAKLYDYFLSGANPIIQTNESYKKELGDDIHLAQLKQALPSEYQAVLREIVVKLLVKFLKFREAKKECHPIVQKVLSLMKSPDRISAGFADICREVNYSKQYIMRIFRSEKLDSPNITFRIIKIEFACGLLVTTTKSIMEIMEAIGFLSLSHFNTIFKAYMGVSPASYRRSQNKLIKTINT